MSQFIQFPIQRYAPTARLLHWAMALIILFMVVTGLLFDDLPKDIKGMWVNLHAVFGSLLLVLLVARVLTRRANPPPREPANMGRVNRALAKYGHYGLYVLMGLVPVLGLFSLYVHGRGIDFGVFQAGPIMERSAALARPSSLAHKLSAYLIMAMAGGHIAMACWHQYVMKDGLLLRMMPAGTDAGSRKGPAILRK